MNTRNLKSIIRKLSAICLAFIMSFGMLISANAEDTRTIADSTGIITINGLDSDNGASISVYKLIDVNFDYNNQQPKEPVYTWATEGLASFASNYPDSHGTDAETTYNNKGAVTDTYLNASAKDLQTFLNALLLPANGSILGTPIFTAETITDGKCVIEGLKLGQYLVVATKDGKKYNPMIANIFPKYDSTGWTIENAEISLKGSTPSISKKIEDENNTVAVGDTINYVIESDIPSYPEDATSAYYYIYDILSAGLKYNGDAKVYYKNGDDYVVVPNDGNSIYSFANGKIDDLEYKENVTPSFTIDFTYSNLIDFIDTLDVDVTKLYVKYSATVTGDAVTYDKINNKAYLGFSNDPYDPSGFTDTPSETETDAYTYGIKINKIGDGETHLAGVEFKLCKGDESDPLHFKGENGSYTYDPTGIVTTLVTDTNGIITIKGLDTGSYNLVETKAASGYVLPTSPFTIVLNDDNADGFADGVLDTTSATDTTVSSVSFTGDEKYASAAGSVDGNNRNMFNVNVTNYLYNGNEDFQLPSTGGMGTVIFTVGGIAVMAAAVALGIYSSRKRNA